MTELILPRRKFLFLAPAIVAVTSLMPVHNIDHLIFKEYGYVCASWDGTVEGGSNYLGWKPGETSASAWISKAEYEYNVRRLSKLSHPAFINLEYMVDDV